MALGKVLQHHPIDTGSPQRANVSHSCDALRRGGGKDRHEDRLGDPGQGDERGRRLSRAGTQHGQGENSKRRVE